jgi:uncharacterized protein YbjT (DUF2867 family)
VPAPKDFRCQSIDAGEVADRLVELAIGPPAGRVPDIGGPEEFSWAEMIRRYLQAAGLKRSVVQVWTPMMKEIRAGALLVRDEPGSAARPYGRTTWEEFLQQRLR